MENIQIEKQKKISSRTIIELLAVTALILYSAVTIKNTDNPAPAENKNKFAPKKDYFPVKHKLVLSKYNPG